MFTSTPKKLISTEEIEARRTLQKIIHTAEGHGFLTLNEKEEKIDDDNFLFDQLKEIEKNTRSLVTPFGLMFNIATRDLDFSAGIINVSTTLKSYLDTLVIMQAEIESCNHIINILKKLAVPACLIENEKISEISIERKTEKHTTSSYIPKENLIFLLKQLKATIAEYKLSSSTTIPSLFYDALATVDLDSKDGLHKAYIALQLISQKKTDAYKTIKAIEDVIKQYKAYFKPSIILWNTAEVNVCLQIESVLRDDNYSLEDKISLIHAKIIPTIADFLDEDKIINEEKLQAADLTPKKVLAAICFAIQEKPCMNVAEKLTSILNVKKPAPPKDRILPISFKWQGA